MIDLRKAEANEVKLGLLFVAPLLLYIIALIGITLVRAFWFSFNNMIIGLPMHFIGLKNYLILLDDPTFRSVIVRTAMYALVAVMLKFLLGMAMALLLNQEFRGREFFRGMFLFPWIVPGVAAIMAWRWFFDDMNGILNYILAHIGLIKSYIPWLAQKETAMAAVVAVNVWRGFPFFGISLLAGLQAIPRDLYEAATVDGSNPIQNFIYITLPSLYKIIVITIMLSTIWTFNDFETVYLLTQGGPGSSTMIMAPYSYNIGILGLNLGKAVAVSFMAVPFLVVFIMLLSRFMLEKEVH